MMQITLAASLLVAAAASATTMIALDLKALSDRADRVVLATVESIESKWTSDHSAIYTEVTLKVERAYKGDNKVGELLVVRREGGSVDGIAMKVYGAPAFSMGEEVVVFSEMRGATRWVVGMAQGKLPVRIQDGKKWVAAPDVTEVQMLPGPRRLEARLRTLDEFERALKVYVKGAK
jgi:hypothetical protein